MNHADESVDQTPHRPKREPSLHKNTQAAYWDERYASTPWAYGLEPNDFLRSQLEKLSATWGTFTGRRALCLADGEGRNGVYLASLGFTVTSLDFSNLARKKALQLAQQRGVELNYHVVDLNDHDPGDQTWDLIVSIFFQPQASTRERLFARLGSVLKPDGRFILEAKHEPSVAPNPPSERYPGLNILRSNLSPLQEVWGMECTRALSEGPYHQGEHAVVQLHAKKMA